MTTPIAESHSVVRSETESPAEQLPILYQDADLVVVNKPSGLLVHRSPIDRHETRFALQLVRDQIGQRVYPVHRLDKPTSGVLIFALSPAIARALTEQFTAHQIEKTYLAVVRGFAPESGIIDHPLVEEPDKMMPGRKAPTEAQSALSHYRCLAQAELAVCIEKYPVSRFSLVEVQPKTGRRHQIRRHLKHINHPIIGDAKHGRGRYNRYFKEQLATDRLLLAATRVCFQHPVTGQALSIQAPLDCCMTQLLQRLGWQAWADHFNQISSPPF
ncbi:tRNA pseudouridine65 synthase [Oceanospirillum multiglobuliferum]|uniref:tRNA pseudouridine(65) synthase TruC n=1 Tax=Oceanospirillum multiglobuliferum TaxID=64969 RepID=UPI0009D4D10A|nr:tRNA pseudouridine(65) synthase TruC [Oceanospirillum multiglobuliferum]SJZ74812.1 tRNA pseudouridine65 synthase [Oceanospirillum multiglobuliferum]